MVELSESTKQDIMQFQTMQQQLQIITYQMQQIAAQEKEIEKAIENVKKSNKGQMFRFVGSVIVPKDKDELLNELEEERKSLSDRKVLFEKQELKLKDKANELKKKLEEIEKTL